MNNQRRLARVEAAFPEPPQPRPEIELLNYMDLEEMERLDGIFQRIEGDEGITNAQDLADCEKIYAAAYQRQSAGLNREDERHLGGKDNGA